MTEKLENLASVDSLTGLSNRTFFKTDLEDLIKELNSNTEERKTPVKSEERKTPLKSVMVIFADIKEFGVLNNTYGHLVGDQALVVLAH